MTDLDDTTTLRVPRAKGRQPIEVPLQPNQLAGRYRIDDEVGRGGMSVVYRGTDLQTGATRAIKVGRLSSLDDARPPERLAAEATILMFLRHPNLVAVHDMGTDATHGLHFAVMDYAPGGSLGDRVKAHGPLAPAEVASVGVQLCCVLTMLHERDILHRDVKPTNLLLDADGRVLLADLGISKIPEAMGDATRDDLVMGSFPYMAPEQVNGMDHTSKAGDLYAVGTTLFRLATDASTVNLFAVRDDAPRWQELPDVLRPAIRHASQLYPEQRPASAWALGAQLAPLAPPELFVQQPHLTEWLEAGEPT